MAITAAEVNKLRKMTGAGMMDCKKALVEAEGDFEQAVDLLRKKGQKIAAKRADRDATEGCVIAATSADNAFGAIVSLNCETDFVAKNDGYVEMAKQFAAVAVDNKPENLEALLALPFGDGMTVSEKLTEQAGRSKSTRLNSSHTVISYAVFCLKKKKKTYYNRKTHYIYLP